MFSLRFLIFLLFLSGTILLAEDTSLTDAERFGREIRKQWDTEKPLNESALKQSSVRRLESKHLTLYTDLPFSEEVDALPKLFDQLIPLLCDYFGLDRKNYESFKIEGFLIDDFDKFKSGGAVQQVPNLRNGYALRCRIWIRNPSSEYYRRHLLLHEGTHAFMGYAFGAWGPPWYREGTAELLGTHCWKDGCLTLGYFPQSYKELARWGRIDIVRDDFSGNQGRTVKGIFELDAEDYDKNEAYGWSWAFAVFCENHPRYRAAFRQTAWKLYGKQAGVGERFLELLLKKFHEESPEWNDQELLYRLDDDWLDFIVNLDYNYDFERTKIDYIKESQPVPKEGTEIQVWADRGWQSAGLRLERGETYRLTASGRFQLAEKPKIWWSEPNGVTLRYYRGIPLGTLLATLVPDVEERFVAKAGTSGVGFSAPRKIGLGDEWTADVSGELFFRINDFPSELSDNQGEAVIEIRR
jgi:hypothetical protein